VEKLDGSVWSAVYEVILTVSLSVFQVVVAIDRDDTIKIAKRAKTLIHTMRFTASPPI